MQPTFWQINPKLWGFDGKCFSFKAQPEGFFTYGFETAKLAHRWLVVWNQSHEYFKSSR